MIVHLEGSQQADRVVTVDEIASWHDLGGGPDGSLSYAVRSQPGGSSQDETVRAPLSLRELVTRLGAETGGPMEGLSVDAVTLVKVDDPRSSYVLTLSGAALAPAGQNGYVDGLMPAFYLPTGAGSVGFVRPLTADPGDVNVQDFMQSDPGGPFEITLNTQGSVLRPTVQASSTQVDADAPVSFSVSYDSPPGTALSYQWSFGDGSSSADPSPSHTWTAAGGYYASVRVQGADGSYGQSNSVLVTVGPKPPSGGATTPGTGASQNTTGPQTGPNHSGGNNGGEIANPGANETTAGPTTGPTTAPTTTPTAGPSTAPTTGPSTGPTTGPSTNPSATATATGKPESGEKPGKGDDGERSPGSGEVQGVLLGAAAVPLPESAPAPGTSEPLAAPSARGGADAPVDPLVGLAAALPLLLLAGAASEGRWLRSAVRRTALRVPALRAPALRRFRKDR